MKRYLPALIAAAFVILFWVLYPGFINGTPEERGQFGDTYGGLNALFSGLAFALLIYTVILQGQELALQREELRMTREELKRTALANEEAAKAMNKQAKAQLLAAQISAVGSKLMSLQTRAASFSGNEGQVFFGDALHSTSTKLKELLEEAETIKADL
jgi:hypothetical protein